MTIANDASVKLDPVPAKLDLKAIEKRAEKILHSPIALDNFIRDDLPALCNHIRQMQREAAAYINAQGPHMSESWREHLAESFGLEVDKRLPYPRVLVPGEKR